MRPESREFFCRDENGRMSDAALHEDILAEGDEVLAFAGSSYRVLRRAGLSDEAVRAAYPELYDAMVARNLKPEDSR